eukprot:scaffold14384_cov48-Attheya_sp.AAC.3
MACVESSSRPSSIHPPPHTSFVSSVPVGVLHRSHVRHGGSIFLLLRARAFSQHVPIPERVRSLYVPYLSTWEQRGRDEEKKKRKVKTGGWGALYVCILH